MLLKWVSSTSPAGAAVAHVTEHTSCICEAMPDTSITQSLHTACMFLSTGGFMAQCILLLYLTFLAMGANPVWHIGPQHLQALPPLPQALLLLLQAAKVQQQRLR